VASFPYFNGTGLVYVCILDRLIYRYKRICRTANSPQTIRGYTDIFTVYTASVSVRIDDVVASYNLTSAVCDFPD